MFRIDVYSAYLCIFCVVCHILWQGTVCYTYILVTSIIFSLSRHTLFKICDGCVYLCACVWVSVMYQWWRLGLVCVMESFWYRMFTILQNILYTKKKKKEAIMTFFVKKFKVVLGMNIFHLPYIFTTPLCLRLNLRLMIQSF